MRACCIAQRTLLSALWWPMGRKSKTERIYMYVYVYVCIYIYIADSLCCMSETNTTL